MFKDCSYTVGLGGTSSILSEEDLGFQTGWKKKDQETKTTPNCERQFALVLQGYLVHMVSGNVGDEL